MISGLISLALIAVSALMVETVHAARHNQVKNHLKDKVEQARAGKKQ